MPDNLHQAALLLALSLSLIVVGVIAFGYIA